VILPEHPPKVITKSYHSPLITVIEESLAAPSAVTIMCIGMKCTLLETESMTVMTVSYLENSRSSTTKLTLSVSHCLSGTESS